MERTILPFPTQEEKVIIQKLHKSKEKGFGKALKCIFCTSVNSKVFFSSFFGTNLLNK